MTRTIHQLYCTHCTYGTSALHRHSGNVRTQPFEYSTRAGSVEQSLSHQTFQRIEKQFFRGIPLAGDASIEIRRRGANDAPWRRLVYSPSVDGMRMLANVCYRSTDTAGRLGSYFAHVLYEEHSSNPDPWNPVDCLKLWGASFWETADTDVSDVSAEALEKSFVLKRLDGLTQPGYGAVINDEVLAEFLKAPADETAPDSDRSGMNNALIVFPTRWRRKTADERSRLLTNLLHAVLELDLESQERLTIAVEPGVAALLFYGIVRLLPPEGLVQQLSFSTFESHFDKSATVLTAHDFADPNATDLLPETYRARGFAINTYRPATNPKFRNPESRFAEMMVQTFIRDGATAADRVLFQMAAVGGLTQSDYESLASVHERVLKSMYGDGTSPDQLTRMSKVEKQFAGRILADRLASASDDAVKSLAGRAAYLSTLDLISGVANVSAARQAERRLVQVLPARNDVRNAFFSLPKLSSSLKVAWLKSYLKQKGQFPQNCPSLWFDGSSQPNVVLSELLQQATTEQVSVWQAFVPPECAWCFAAALGSAVQHDPAKRPLLISKIELLDDDGLCKLLDKASGRADMVLKAIEYDDPRFTARLTVLNDEIQTAPSDKVAARVETLLAISSHLPYLRNSLIRWVTVREAIKRCEQYGATSNGRKTGELESALCDVLKAVSAALSKPDEIVSPIEIDVKLVEPMLRAWLGSKHQELCQQSINLLPKLQLAATDDTGLCTFLADKRCGGAWLGLYPRDDPSLPQRLRTILEELPDNLSSLPVRLAGLTAAKSFLGPDASRLDVWRRLNEMLVWIKKMRGRFSRASDMNGDDVMKAAMDLAPLVFLTLKGRISCDPTRESTKKLVGTSFLENLSRATIGDNTLLESKMMLRWIEVEYEKQSSSKGGSMLSGFFK